MEVLHHFIRIFDFKISIISFKSICPEKTCQTRCGLGTDRSGVLAAGPDFAGYQSIIRLAGFCWTGTGVRRVKYKAAGTCLRI